MNIEQQEDKEMVKKIQEAPERRVFYVDTGDMPSEKAIEYLNKIKEEINK